MVLQASVMLIGCACSMTATATAVMGRRASGPRLVRLAGSLSSRSETAGISPKTHLVVASQRRGDRDADGSLRQAQTDLAFIPAGGSLRPD
jgi:hypothetical protein